MKFSQILTALSGTQALFLLCVALICLYFYCATSYHGVWEKVGIPGPKPWPGLDHLPEIRHGINVAMDKWFQQYGNTFGVYGILPRTATLITKDLSLIRDVLVKDFNNFHSRLSLLLSFDPLLNQGVSSVGGDRWSRQRRATSPMFSAVKMKTMMHHVNTSVTSLMAQVNQLVDQGQLIPVKDIADSFASEVMARTELGLTTHGGIGQTSQFQFHSQNLLNFGSWQKFLMTFRSFFPQIFNCIYALKLNVSLVNNASTSYFTNLFGMVIQSKHQDKPTSSIGAHKARDMLGLMMEAQVDEKDPQLSQKESRVLSETEVLANCLLLILAGVETMSTTFRSLLYCLAVHPEVQDKVVAEIAHVVPEQGQFQYEYLSELKYTEQVINECLRLFPLVANTYRQAVQTKSYEGITIPKDTYVQIPYDRIMVDPEHWPDPHKFDPDRFSPENKEGRDPLAFMPFGYGPRVCLGQRLAMMELKVVLSALLKKFSFKLSDRTTPKKGEAPKFDTRVGTLNRHSDKVEIEAVFRS